VAVRCRVAAGIDSPTHRFEPRVAFDERGFRSFWKRNRMIAHVTQPARGGYVPPAPPLLERGAMVDDEFPEPSRRLTVRSSGLAAGQESRHGQRAVGLVARETAAGPRQLPTGTVLLIQRVENGALPRIENGYFEKGSAADVANDDRIVEEQRARISRTGTGA